MKSARCALILIKAFVYVLLCLSFLACSTLDKSQCESGDWSYVGSIDGLNGRPPNYVKMHKQSCKDVPVNETEYEKGRQKGLVDYCGASNAFRVGAAGLPYFGVCEKTGEKVFREHYALGRKVFLLKERRTEVTQEIEDEKKRIDEDKSVLNHAVQAFHLIGGSSPTGDLDSRKDNIDKELFALESQKPIATHQSIYALESSKNNLMLNSVGAMTGTFFGFGIGHAIQGRYKSAGWKWTVGDIAWIGVMSATHNKYCTTVDPSIEGTESQCANSLPGLSILSFLGLRVWQSIGLWSNVSGSEYETGYQLLVKPNGLGLAGTF